MINAQPNHTNEELWRTIEASFQAHRKAGDGDAQAALNRIAAKCLGLDQVRPFDRQSCTVREELLRFHELTALKRYHTRATPLRVFEPIVLLEWRGVRWVIEGNSGVNKWIADKDGQARRAIIITPIAVAA